MCQKSSHEVPRAAGTCVQLALGRCRSAQALAAAEAEHAAAERRQELFVLLRNAAKVFPEEGYAVVGPRLQALASEGRHRL